MGGMVNCKFFLEKLYLIRNLHGNIILIQTEGVMAARLGESRLETQINIFFEEINLKFGVGDFGILFVRLNKSRILCILVYDINNKGFYKCRKIKQKKLR